MRFSNYDGKQPKQINQTGSSITIDSKLSETSENPVQNKVVTQEINSINSNLRPTKLITDGLVLGEYSKAIYNGYGYYRFGNIVIVNVALEFNSTTTPNNFNALSGFPQPVSEVYLTTNYESCIGSINTSGELHIYNNTDGSNTALSGVYICKEV